MTVQWAARRAVALVYLGGLHVSSKLATKDN